jgi:hypothetical protein
MRFRSRVSGPAEENVMAKGQMKSNKEKKKPKAEKNQKPKHVPFGGKTPPNAMGAGKK